MAAESFDAVLVEMRADARLENGKLAHDAATGGQLEAWADRLQAAHEREVGERDTRITDLQAALYRWVPHADYCQQAGDDAGLLMGMTECPATEPGEELRCRADAAVALLRECEDAVFGKDLWQRIRAFLAQQGNGEEKGNG